MFQQNGRLFLNVYREQNLNKKDYCTKKTPVPQNKAKEMRKLNIKKKKTKVDSSD